MNRKNQTILLTKEQAAKDKKWYIFDASGKTLGRFASEIANVLRGKHKPDFTPHVDTGDRVIVINASKIKVTGNKEAQKEYIRYTGYIGGQRRTPYRVMQEKNPEFIITHAVKGMLPKTRLGRHQMKKLRVFAGENHNMQAQQPEPVTI